MSYLFYFQNVSKTVHVPLSLSTSLAHPSVFVSLALSIAPGTQ